MTERSSRTLTIEVADAIVTVALIPILAYEATHDSQPGWLVLINWVLFVALLLLAGLRVRIGAWQKISTVGKSLEVLLLVAALPLASRAGPLRLLRLLRLPLIGGRSLRGLRERVVDRGSLLVATSALFTTVIGALLILEAEAGQPDSKFTTVPDALWWATATMTTVGYGDLAPTTALGRVIAVFVMIIGIALFGLTTALLAKWLVGGKPEDEPATRADVAALREEVRSLRSAIAGESSS
ncbi:MAG TPA: potassium channel family protein [Acidimicrobiales bacterium]|nr:potassium channel family protein [Acidimicrobiales bacterium]